MTGTLSTLTFNLLIVVPFVAVVFVMLRIAQSVFGTSSKKAAATEVAAKLVSYPTGSSAVLRRRFVRALTGQHERRTGLEVDLTGALVAGRPGDVHHSCSS